MQISALQHAQFFDFDKSNAQPDLVTGLASAALHQLQSFDSFSVPLPPTL